MINSFASARVRPSRASASSRKAAVSPPATQKPAENRSPRQRCPPSRDSDRSGRFHPSACRRARHGRSSRRCRRDRHTSAHPQGRASRAHRSPARDKDKSQAFRHSPLPSVPARRPRAKRASNTQGQGETTSSWQSSPFVVLLIIDVNSAKKFRFSHPQT